MTCGVGEPVGGCTFVCYTDVGVDVKCCLVQMLGSIHVYVCVYVYVCVFVCARDLLVILPNSNQSGHKC